MNVYDEGAVLPMAIRMRRAGNCPGDIDNLYGEIMAGIVHMATVLLPKEDPRYEMHLDEFLTPDVQMHMLCQCLSAAERYVDTNTSPKRIINYLVKTVQNRLRNYVRDTEKRREKVAILSEYDMGLSISDITDRVMSFDGNQVYGEVRGKVNTFELD